MGSGFFPVVIGVIVAIMGFALVVRALMRPETSEPVDLPQFRPLLFIGLAVVVFGLLIEDVGLLASLAALIILARFAGREGGSVELAIMVITLIAIAVTIFVYGLNLRLKLVP